MSKLTKNNYSTPAMMIEELKVERGFALSSDYGGFGEPGQGSGYIDGDFEL